MLPCQGCGYRTSIPGDTHIRCVFSWFEEGEHLEALVALLMGATITERTHRWFRFPFNFDPVWGPDVCPMRAETRDPAKVAPPNPWADLLSLASATMLDLPRR
jgi:hypothetical protein